jgi:hypothetical protein
MVIIVVACWGSRRAVRGASNPSINVLFYIYLTLYSRFLVKVSRKFYLYLILCHINIFELSKLTMK